MKVQQAYGQLSEAHVNMFAKTRIWQPELHGDWTWREAALDARAIAGAASRLSPGAAAVLRVMALHFPAVPAEEERLLSLARTESGLSGAETRLALRELELSGILFALRKQWGEYTYVMPVECLMLWQPVLWPLEAASLAADSDDKLPHGQPRPYRRALSKQLLSAFSTLAKADTTLTKKGVLPKRTIERLELAVELDEKLLRSYSMQWPHREHYPLTVAFVLEAACALGLLGQNGASLRWRNEALLNWLDKADNERERELLEWCLAVLMPQAGKEGRGMLWTAACMDRNWRSDRRWRSGAPDGQAEHSPISKKAFRWLDLMHDFGWMEVIDSEDDSGERWFRWSPALAGQAGEPAADSAITVQPQGELLAEEHCSFRIRWELELLAERISEERLVIYQLKQETIANALEHGRKADEIKAYLRAVSGGSELPHSVTTMLEAWTANVCRFSFTEAVLLRCDGEEMARVIDSIPELAPLLLGKLGPADYIVRRSGQEEIRRRLKLAGYPPRKGTVTEEAGPLSYPVVHVHSGMARVETEGTHGQWSDCAAFLYSPNALCGYEWCLYREREQPPVSQATLEAPKLWTNQLRAYHHSTRKELLEQALEWETPVELRMENGLHAFVPEQLVADESGSWAVVGLLREAGKPRQVRLTPGMWDEMRLVIPQASDQP